MPLFSKQCEDTFVPPVPVAGMRYPSQRLGCCLQSPLCRERLPGAAGPWLETARPSLIPNMEQTWPVRAAGVTDAKRSATAGTGQGKNGLDCWVGLGFFPHCKRHRSGRLPNS